MTDNCCPCGVFLCECRFDAAVAVGGPIVGAYTGPPGDCAILNTAGGLNTEPTISTFIPEAVRMWPPEWTCRYMSTMGFKITAFPPLCTDPDIARHVVFVKKTTPIRFEPLGAANDTLELEDWYAVVYSTGYGGTAVTLISINFNFQQCCLDRSPESAATSHLIWVKFPGTDFGPWSYDVKLLNTTSLEAYGDCTEAEITS